LAVFLANYTDAPVDFEYRIEPVKLGLKGTHFELKELSPEGSVPITTVTGTVQRTEKLGPGKLKVIEIEPKADD